jgi:hypothetical protein
MNLLWAILVTSAVAGVAIAALLVVRRRAPEGGYFNDGDRAAGVFGVLATGFSVLLGLVVFLAFLELRPGAQRRGGRGAADRPAVRDRPVDAAVGPRRLGGELVCYGRAVVHREWPLMRTDRQGDGPNPWGVALFRTVGGIAPRTPAEQSAYDKWLDRTADREEARRDRIHGAVGVISGPL